MEGPISPPGEPAATFPVHVIIGKRGAIAARLMGAGDGRAEELARLIDQALAD